MEEQKESFKISNLEGATWCFKKIRSNQAKMDEAAEVANKELADLKKDIEHATARKNEIEKEYKNDIEYFQGLLNAYYREQRHFDKRFKLTTIWGKVTSRNTTQLFITDEDQAFKHFEDNDKEAIRVKKELDKKYINSKYKGGIDQATGEILPFMKTEEVETITVKVE